MTEPHLIRWYVLAEGGHEGETLRASGTLSLEEWIEPTDVAALAAGTIEGLSKTAYDRGIGDSPFGDGVRFAIVVEYPRGSHDRG